MKTIRVALESSPNVLHAGMYLACLRGWYRDAGLDVLLLEPESASSPMKLLVSGQVHVAISPAEGIVSYRTLRQEQDLVAIATIGQEHQTALAALATSGISSPAMLDGKRYGAHQSRFEAAILRRMISHSGGCGLLRMLTPPRQEMWQHLLEGRIDAAWISIPKRLPQAEKQGITLNLFKPEDHGVIPCYMHLLVAHRCLLDEYESDFRTFLELTNRAYEWVAAHPGETTGLLVESQIHPAFHSREELLHSLALLCPVLLNSEGRWGVMNPQRWEEFGEWLDQNHIVQCLETEEPILVGSRIRQWFSNDYLPAFRSDFVSTPGETA
jgi:ABC-type nitrate/sulfonate/bicarbonate transport system substrate-binding protein